MKNSIKDKLFNYMFNTLCKERHSDLIRAVSAMQSGEKRGSKSTVLRKWFRETTGETPELSSEQLSDVQDTWKDIWDTGLVDPLWVQVYSGKTGIYSPEYVGSDIHYYNVEWSKIDFDYLRAFLDKNYMDVILPCVKHPTTLIRKIHGQYLDVGFNPITKQQAVEKLFENLDPGVVVKISRASSGGKGVRFLGKGSTRDDISDALDVDRDVAVQLVMQQHPEMAKMNASSVNTIRIICIMLDGESIPLSAVVRIGNSGSRVDNFSSGGVGCGVKPDGHLNDCGYTQKGERYDVHPNGFVFSEGFVPNFDKALEAVKRCHMHVPMFGVASWDIAIDADGEPVLIEYNVGGAGIDIHQYNNGPLYGKYRERIIADAFKNYAERGATLDFNYSIARGEATLSNGSKDVHNLIIPALIDGKPVRTIASSAFKNSDKLESVAGNGDDRIRPADIARIAQENVLVLIGVGQRRAGTGGGRQFFAPEVGKFIDTAVPEGQKVVFNHGFHEGVHGSLPVGIQRAVEPHMLLLGLGKRLPARGHIEEGVGGDVQRLAQLRDHAQLRARYAGFPVGDGILRNAEHGRQLGLGKLAGLAIGANSVSAFRPISHFGALRLRLRKGYDCAGFVVGLLGH